MRSGAVCDSRVQQIIAHVHVVEPTSYAIIYMPKEYVSLTVLRIVPQNRNVVWFQHEDNE